MPFVVSTTQKEISIPFDLTPKKALSNRILSALPSIDQNRIKTKLDSFELKFGDVINEPGQMAEYIYFPDSGLISLLGTLGGGDDLEIGIVGNNGALPLSPFLDVPSSPVRAIVQGHGVAQRINVADFHDECLLTPKLMQMLLHFTNSLMLQISQLALCFRFHKTDERLARWLLTMSDGMISDEFRLTHEFLANMLGVRREGVSVAAHHFQELGMIRYSRGNIKILDRKALENASCVCYSILK